MKNQIKAALSILSILLLFALISSCTKNEISPDYSPPADHTISKDGFMHKSGLNDPEANCVACHGADLRGGTTAVSCFECHDKEW